MTPTTDWPDTHAILGGLKDFQRRTVDYVFRRLYADIPPARRFLIADEVGLGKTLVARGLIARAIERLKDQVQRIDIVYICSNAEIARQNINRLNVTGKSDFSFASRITLLPLQLKSLEQSRLNFISFTPATSFDLRSALGIGQERALIYRLLEQAWDLAHLPGAVDVLRGSMWRGNFWYEIGEIAPECIEQSLADAFVEAVRVRPQLLDRFWRTAEAYAAAGEDGAVAEEDRLQRRWLVGELRALLASTCLRKVEPDLIILDEFQRFKQLLDAGDETSRLAHQLFEYSDHESHARVVLLSATPYKMYTLSHEAAEDDHYQDFVRTIRFLQERPQAMEFERLLGNYRRELLQLGVDGGTGLFEAKNELEGQLRQVMVRTERLSTSETHNGMLEEVHGHGGRLERQDIQAYLSLQKVARVLQQGNTLEYWKSAPFLLNFMEDYEIKRAFGVARSDRESELAAALRDSQALLLPSKDVVAYQAIDPSNSRLRGLVSDMIDPGIWQLLWIPPSLPYYQLEAPYTGPGLTQWTKRLIFSSWRVVPKVIATLVSYEAERRMIRSFDAGAINTAEERVKRRGLLRIATAEQRPTGMPVFGLMYPSQFLAEVCDPLVLGWGNPSLDIILERAQRRIQHVIDAAVDQRSGPEDERWYWAAPIVLDLTHRRQETQAWLEAPELDQGWGGEDGAEAGQDVRSAWSRHVDQARELLTERLKLGRPPDDLPLVLALLGIAGPGVTALRSLMRATNRTRATSSIRTSAAHVAWQFRSLFNMPEVMAIVRGLYGGAADDDEGLGSGRAEPYWRQVVRYCAAGGLQAVLDEYAHVLREALGLLDLTSGDPASEAARADDAARQIAQAMADALSLRTASVTVDDLSVADGQHVVTTPYRMRCHFALRFGEERADDGRVVTRTEQVRQSFNSPFWPFVLATTSVGQEGLDFHTYCHAVVHWNLPANPVDLEQREGRVHRYKGHAVRKNLARTYAPDLPHTPADPWAVIFEMAARNRSPGQNDLIPYWIYTVPGGAVIERHVPALPLSRDRERMSVLRRSLAAYRMVFGQTRQEDLLAYLLARLPEDEVQHWSDRLRINLEPPEV